MEAPSPKFEDLFDTSRLHIFQKSGFPYLQVILGYFELSY